MTRCSNRSILIASSGSAITLYSANGSLITDRIVSANNNDLTFNMGTGQFVINGPVIMSSENAVAGDTTPSVASTSVLRFNNTSGVSVSGLDGGYNDQYLVALLEGNTTIVHTSGVIELDNSISFTPATGGTLTLFNDSGVWRELSRTIY